MGFPSFASGDVLTATDMNAVGLWRIAQYSFTGQSFVDFTMSNVFSSTYENYRIVYTLTNNLAGNFYYLKFPGSTGATYQYITPYYTFGSTTQTNASLANTANGIALGLTTTGFDTGVIDIYAPGIARATGTTGQSTNALYPAFHQGADTNAVAQTGVTFANTGAHRFTAGKVVVYGYRVV